MINNKLKLLLVTLSVLISSGFAAGFAPAGQLNFKFNVFPNSVDTPTYDSVSLTGIPSSIYVKGTVPNGNLPAWYSTNLLFYVYGINPAWTAALTLSVTPKIGNYNFAPLVTPINVINGVILGNYPMSVTIYSKDGTGAAECEYGVQAGASSTPATFLITCGDIVATK